jgi:hypothetical protein
MADKNRPTVKPMATCTNCCATVRGTIDVRRSPLLGDSTTKQQLTLETGRIRGRATVSALSSKVEQSTVSETRGKLEEYPDQHDDEARGLGN